MLLFGLHLKHGSNSTTVCRKIGGLAVLLLSFLVDLKINFATHGLNVGRIRSVQLH